MAEAIEKKGKYRIFCPDFGALTCFNTTEEQAKEDAAKLQRQLKGKVELAEITEDLGGVRIDVDQSDKGKEVSEMAQEKPMCISLVGGKGKLGGGLDMTLEEAFKLAAKVREVMADVRLIWSTPSPFNGEIKVIF